MFEIQLATHGACRDRQNVIRYTGKLRHIVERFRGDDGAVHIGDEKLFLAVVRRNDVHIDAVHIAVRAKLCHTVGVNCCRHRKVERMCLVKHAHRRQIGINPCSIKDAGGNLS